MPVWLQARPSATAEVNHAIRPSHLGFEILRYLDHQSHWATAAEIRKGVMAREFKCQDTLRQLQADGLIKQVDAIVNFTHPWELTSEGRRVLLLIEDWHRQGWFKRTFGPPPPTI